MASKSMKPSVPARPKELTEEEKEQMQLRAIAQKRESFAQMAFASIARCDGMQRNPADVAKWSVSAADSLIEELYGKAIKVENIEK